MRVINRYLIGDFLSTFFVTLAVFTFVMCVGAVVKAIDLLARGVSGRFILEVFFYNVPFIMTFSIPMSVLTTTLLLFSRLSHDGEITALRASGLSLWQMVAPVILLAIGASLICLYLNAMVAPKCHYAQRKVLAELGVEEPINLLEEGRFVRDFPGFMVYVGKKERNTVQDVILYELGPHGPVRTVRANSGQLTTDKEKQTLRIDLRQVRIEESDPRDPMNLSRTRFVPADEYTFAMDMSAYLRKGTVRKKATNMTFPELIRTVRSLPEQFPDLTPEDLRLERMKLLVDANERLALSVACFAFTLLGIPLGLRSHRKESSVGVAVSLFLVFLFYLFIIIADALVDRPAWRPDLIVWFPVLAAEAIGFLLIRRAN